MKLRINFQFITLVFTKKSYKFFETIDIYLVTSNFGVNGFNSIIRLTDTKVKRYIKIRGEANLYDAEWRLF